MATREMPESNGPKKIIDYSNSNKKKEAEQKKIDRVKEVKSVVVAPAKIHKKSLGDRFAETFLGDDLKSVRSYVIYDVLIPAAKDTLSSVVSNGLDMLLFGESKHSSRVKRDKNKSYISYNDYYDRKPSNRGYSGSHSKTFDNMVFTTREEAEDVMTAMFDMLEQYDAVPVSAMYELAGRSSDFTMRKWGWTDLSGICIRLTRSGYLLEVPRPIELEE